MKRLLPAHVGPASPSAAAFVGMLCSVATFLALALGGSSLDGIALVGVSAASGLGVAFVVWLRDWFFNGRRFSSGGDSRSGALTREERDLLTAATGDALWIARVNPDTLERQIIYANEGFEAIWGRKIGELKTAGCVYNNWIHRDDYDWVGVALTAFLKGEVECDLEFRVNRPDGEPRWVWSKANRVLDEEGRIKYVVGFSRDISELKESRRKQEESERYYRSLFNSSSDAIRIVGLDGSTLDVNPAFERLVGREREELIGLSCKELTPPEWLLEETEIVEGQVLERGYSDLYEKEYYTGDGGRVLVEMRLSLIRDPKGEPKAICGIARDISQERKKQQELVEAKMVAEEASRSKDRFLAMISHELRTPLNPIIGYAELLIKRLSDPAAQRFLGVIRESARGMTKLVNEILEYSMNESGREETERVPFRVSEVVNIVREQMEPAISEKGLAFEVEMDGENPLLFGDRQKLQQILSNLLGNACKFTERGSVRMFVQVNETVDRKRVVSIEVSDTGIGIPSEKLDAIFEPFEQVGSVHKAETRGVGLGLAICQQFARKLEGSLSVESDFGKGSTFRLGITLPLAEAFVYSDGEYARQLDRVQPKKLRILVAEDEPLNRLLMVDTFKEIGYASELVSDGEAALNRLEQEPFDIVFIDLSMPLRNGLEVVRNIRASKGPNCSVPFIALTAHVSERVRLDCLKGGMSDVLPKPINAETIEGALVRWVYSDGIGPTARV